MAYLLHTISLQTSTTDFTRILDKAYLSRIMPLDNQFSLSLELTRLLPLGQTINALGSAVSKVARELTASGSDIVIEEDLAAIFGRLRICQHFEKTFRAVVGSTERTGISKLLDIALESGPGPTVQRALAAPGEDSRYLSTIIQLSLLSYVHEPTSLADGLSYVLQKRLDSAAPDCPPAPGYDALFGIIRACQEQTNRFQWHFVLDRVRQDLGQVYEKSYAMAYPTDSRRPFVLQSNCRALSYPVIQGLIDMFLVIQSLPEDRTVYIETLKGVPTIVAWAHHVLGFTVVVKLFDTDGTQQSRSFGEGLPQIVIDARNNSAAGGSEICLLSGTKERLFYLTDEEDQSKTPLEASRRHPLGSFGASVIISAAEQQRISLNAEQKESLLQQIALDVVSRGIACFLATGSSWRPDKPKYGNSLQDFVNLLKDTPYQSWNRVERALSVIFGVQLVEVEEKVFALLDKGDKDYHKKHIQESYQIPGSRSIKVNIDPLVVLVSGFSCVDEVEECIDLLVPDAFGQQNQPGLSPTQLRRAKTLPIWERFAYSDRIQANNWNESTLLDIFARILIGPSFRMGNERLRFMKTGLISEYGWSVFLPSVDVIDPSEVSIYRIHLKRGVPVRSDVRRRRIEDGGMFTKPPKTSSNFSLWPNDRISEEDSAESIPVAADIEGVDRDSSGASFSHAKVGVTNTAFVVTFTIQGQSWGAAETGMRQMHRISTNNRLWRVDACDHYIDRNCDTLIAPTEISEVYLAQGVDGLLSNSVLNRKRYDSYRTNGYFLLLTSGNIAGRWLSLCFWDGYARKVCLRHPQACLRCVLDTVKAFPFPKSSEYPPFEQRVIIL
jgi:hypothetical protein